ncbi:MAG: ABC transporter permease [Agriterribacter sp.]
MILFHIKIAWRNIRKNKVFSIINIAGLALSLACCLIISMYVWNELSYDGFHSKKAQIYRVTELQDQAGTQYKVAVTPGPLAPALQKDFPEIVRTVRFGSWSGTLKNGQHNFEENSILLTENSIFRMFDFRLTKGDPATALANPDEIVITEQTAVKYFGEDWRGNPDILGQVFRLNDQVDFKLSGIVENPPANSSIQFDILLPVQHLFASDEWSNKWNSNNYHTYIELQAGTDGAVFQQKIGQELQRYNSDTKDLLQLQPLSRQYLYSAFDFQTDWGKRSEIRYVRIFAGVGLLLLIIACVNFINLSTARSLKRSMEVGVKKVTGASRKQLILQFLTESTMLAMISALLAMVIIKTAQPLLNGLTGGEDIINITHPVFVGFFLLFTVVTGLLAGFYPALVLSSFKPVGIFKSNTKIKTGRVFWRTLVVFQFAISVTLMICATFMYQQLQFIQAKDLGFDKEQLLSIKLKGGMMEKATLMKQDFAKVPSVAAAAPSTISMVNVENSSYLEWEGMVPGDKFLITQANVTPDFIPTLGITLLAGSNFSPQKTNDTANYIVNETAVKRMGYTDENAIGKRIDMWGAKGRIIGVVKNFNFKSLNVGVEPFIFRYQPQDRYFNLLVKTTPGQTAATIKALQRAYKKYDSTFAMDFSFVNDAIDNLYKQDKRTANLLLFFTCLTIFVGCLGLFGLTVFAAEQRIKEIGIRKVLGATLSSLTILLSKDFIKLVLVALIVAAPVGWYVTNTWLQNFAYRIPLDWRVFATVGIVVVAIAYLTICIQAIKTAAGNPLKALRSE